MVTTKKKPATRSRGRSRKSVQTKMPVQMDELPEYRDAVAWAASVRAEAERRIARETSEVPDGVLKRIAKLVGNGITQRHSDAVSLWSGIPAHGMQAGSGDFSSIEYLMKSIALLPEDGADVAQWWRLQADNSVTKHEDQVFFLIFVDGHRTCVSESAILLRDCMRGLIKALLPAIPGPVALARRMLAEQAALPVEQRRAIKLSEVVLVLNEMEWRRDRTESDTREHGGKRYNVEEVLQTLTDAGISDILVDCGEVRNAAQMRDAIAEFGERVRGCVACQNWFAVEEEQVPYFWYNRCPGCAYHSFRGVIMSGGSYGSREEQLMGEVRKRTEATIDVRVHLALVEKTTVAHAGRMLLGETDPADLVTADLKTCPVAASCKSACGVMQDKGLRPIPLTPIDGKYEFCQIFAYRRMVDGIDDGEAREKIALEWLREMKDDQRTVAKRQAETFAAQSSEDDAEDAGSAIVSVADETEVARPAEVKVQGSLF